MLGKDRRSFDNEEPVPGGNGTGSVNLISAGTVIEGEINCRGDLRVDGKVIGRINSKAKVVIGNTGEVEGDIVCQHADVFGQYNGNMRSEEHTSELQSLMRTSSADFCLKKKTIL